MNSWYNKKNVNLMSLIAAICGSPPSISNGSPGTPTSIIQGGTVVYSCNTGYQLLMLGSATVVCQDSGNWSPRPNCLGNNYSY